MLYLKAMLQHTRASIGNASEKCCEKDRQRQDSKLQPFANRTTALTNCATLAVCSTHPTSLRYLVMLSNSYMSRVDRRLFTIQLNGVRSLLQHNRLSQFSLLQKQKIF